MNLWQASIDDELQQELEQLNTARSERLRALDAQRRLFKSGHSPSGILLDVAHYLDRASLDAWPLTSRYFRTFHAQQLMNICLRRIYAAMLSFEDQLSKPSFGEKLMTVCLMEEGKSGVKAHRVHLAFTDPQTWSKDQWITSPNLSSLDDGLEELENRLRHSTVDVIILYKLALHPVHAQSLHEIPTYHLGQLIDFCPRRVQLGLSWTSTEHLQLSDEFLVKYVGKIKRLNLCGSGSSRFTEQGVLEFIFQESAEWVILQVDSTTITSSFPSRLLQRAQQSTALNETTLLLRHGAWDAANNDLPGMQDFGDYRTGANDGVMEYRLPQAGQVQLSLELKENTLRFDRILLKRSGQK